MPNSGDLGVAMLREKLADRFKWLYVRDRLCAERGRARSSISTVPRYFIGSEQSSNPWWADREQARMDYKVYYLSTVLEAVNTRIPDLFAHVSLLDPTMVAYTPSIEAGESDKQIMTSLGKFLRKFFPLMADHSIEALTNEHKSDISTEVEFLVGQEITDVYLSGVFKTCMTKPSESFSGLQGHHPTEVYHAPHIRMAVLRNEEGEINAKCLVYEPSPEDLRYIRVYGDNTLRRRLERRGYRAGSFEGVAFNKVKLDDRRYLMPYLDSHGDMVNSRSPFVALVDGVLTCISKSKVTAYSNDDIEGTAANPANTEGSCILDEYLTKGEDLVDPISGLTYNSLADRYKVRNFYWHGEIVQSVVDTGTYAELSEATHAIAYRSIVRGGTQHVWGTASTPTFSCGYEWVDTPKNRERNGHIPLSADLYPDAPDKFVNPSDACWISYDGNDAYVLKSDCVRLLTFNYDGQIWTHTHMHKAVLDRTVNTKVHKLQARDLDTWAPINKVVKTRSGRKVVIGYHNVRKNCVSGVVDFEKNLCRVDFGWEVYYISHEGHPAYEAERDVVIQRGVDKYLDYCRESYEYLWDIRYNVGRALGLNNYGNDPRDLNGRVAKFLSEFNSFTADPVKRIARDKLRKGLIYLLAEINAVEA